MPWSQQRPLTLDHQAPVALRTPGSLWQAWTELWAMLYDVPPTPPSCTGLPCGPRPTWHWAGVLTGPGPGRPTSAPRAAFRALSSVNTGKHVENISTNWRQKHNVLQGPATTSPCLEAA